MRSVMIICAGSRGDVEPFAVLARALATAQEPWKVLFCVQSDYAGLSEARGNVEVFRLPFTQLDMESIFRDPDAVAEASAAASEEDNKSLFGWSCIGAMSAKLIVPSTEAVLKACTEAKVDVVVYTLLTRPLALSVAEKIRAKSCYVHLQPQVPTGVFPHHRLHELAAEGIVNAASVDSDRPSSTISNEVSRKNLESYWAVERAVFKACGEAMNVARKQIGLSALSFEECAATAVGDAPDMIIANAFPGALVPHCHDLSKTVHAVGPLADGYIADSWSPDQALVDYLQAGPPPVCVGFGSMRLSSSASRVIRLVFEALRAAGVDRIVVVGGIAAVGSDLLDDREDDAATSTCVRSWAETHSHQLQKPVPYAWLLPQCSMIICHGGAGVVAAALRAGCVPVVTPVVWDQFMWANVIDRLGLGVFAGPSISDVSLTALTDSIQKARQEKMVSAVRTHAQVIRENPSGTVRLATLLDELVSL